MEIEKSIQIFLNKDDDCFTCGNRYGCPLIEALAQNAVSPNGDVITVKDCVHYVEENSEH